MRAIRAVRTLTLVPNLPSANKAFRGLREITCKEGRLGSGVTAPHIIHSFLISLLLQQEVFIKIKWNGEICGRERHTPESGPFFYNFKPPFFEYLTIQVHVSISDIRMYSLGNLENQCNKIKMGSLIKYYISIFYLLSQKDFNFSHDKTGILAKSPPRVFIAKFNTKCWFSFQAQEAMN